MQAIPMSPRRLKLAHAMRRFRMWRAARAAYRRHHYTALTLRDAAGYLAAYVVAMVLAVVVSGWLAGIDSWGIWR